MSAAAWLQAVQEKPGALLRNVADDRKHAIPSRYTSVPRVTSAACRNNVIYYWYTIEPFEVLPKHSLESHRSCKYYIAPGIVFFPTKLDVH